MSSFLDEIKNKLKEGRTELKIISGGGKLESEGSNNSNSLWIWVVVFIVVAIIIVVIVMVLSNNNTDGNPNLIQMDKEKEDPEEIIKDLSEANERIEQKQKENEQEYQDPNFTLLKDLVHG